MGAGGQSIDDWREHPEQKQTHMKYDGIVIGETTSRDTVIGGKYRTGKWHISDVIKGSHPGCIEKRKKCKGNCEYDGKVSITYFKDHYYIYVRANAANRGGRYVSVAKSEGVLNPNHWGGLRPLHILGYGEEEVCCYASPPILPPSHPPIRPTQVTSFACSMLCTSCTSHEHVLTDSLAD